MANTSSASALEPSGLPIGPKNALSADGDGPEPNKPGHFHATPRDQAAQVRRTQTLNVACILISGVATFRLGFFWLVGEPLGMAWFGAVIVAMLAIRGAQNRYSLSVRGNLLVALLLVSATMEVHYRGGVGTVVAAGMAVVPLLATMLMGRKTGAFWLVAVCASTVGIAIFETAAVDLLDQVPLAYQFRTNLVLSLLIPTLIFSIGFVFDWINEASLATIAETERSKFEAQQAASMVLADRMASMGILAAGVGHEINNPLTYVIGNLSILEEILDDLEPDSETEAAISELIDDIRVGAERIQRISRDLKVFARSNKAGVSRSTSASEVVESALSLVRHELRHHATTQTSLEDDLYVWGDETGLVQIVVNLLVNAVKAVQMVDRPGTITVSLFEADGNVVFEVEDNGPGIAQEHLEQIFQPFFTTRDRGSGTGLGLAISRSIATKHKGSLEYRPASESGAVFQLAIPQFLGFEQTPDTSDRVAPDLPQMRIMIIDDEVSVCRVVASMLRDHEVVTLAEGQRAVNLLRAGEQFDAILCDLMMPEMDGVAVYDWIFEHRPECISRFVAMSGGASSARTLNFVRTNSVPLVDKPVSRTKLFEALARCSASRKQ